MARKSKQLEVLGNQINNLTNDINIKEIPIVFLEELTNNITYGITDNRAIIAYQPLENVLMITFLGLLANCNEWTEIYEFAVLHKEWLEKFLNLQFRRKKQMEKMKEDFSGRRQ